MELRQALSEVDDLVVLYVMAGDQVNAKARRFLEEDDLRGRIRFLVDPDSRVIESLGLLLPNPEPIEDGVAYPATYLLDRDGRIRFADVRTDFHAWLAPELVLATLAELE